MTDLMNSRRHPVAVAALGAALLTGVAADLLLRTDRLGINLWLLSIVFQVLLALLHRRYHTSMPWTSFALILGSGSLLLSFAWRDSPALNALALLGAVAAAGLAAWTAQGGSLRHSAPMQYAGGIARSAAGAMFGILPLAFRDADWAPWGGVVGSTRWARVGRGLVLAMPPVVILGSLLAAADPIFSAFSSRFFDLDLEPLMVHGVIIGVVGWVMGGFLRDLVLLRPVSARLVSAPRGGLLGFTETMIVLGSVSLLFLLFVAIQVRALFGGDAFVLAEAGLTYAEYARQGFFHMTWATTLVLPLLLVLEWAGQRDGTKQKGSFRALAVLLLGLLGVVLFSAFDRMRIYQASFGLTELRVYTVAFMAWLAPVLGWFGLTVLAGRRERFAPGVVTLAILTVIGLHVVNPDHLIARTNLARGVEGAPFDAAYALSLSDDAMPALVQAMDMLDGGSQCSLLARLERAPDDWRSWNRSRHHVQDLAREMAGRLERLRQACAVPHPS
jgi:hypothetical protein